MQIDNTMLIIGLIITIVILVGLLSFTVGRLSTNRPNVDRNFSNGHGNAPTETSSFWKAVWASIVGATIISLSWILYQSQPWTDRHGHNFLEMVECDVLGSTSEICVSLPIGSRGGGKVSQGDDVVSERKEDLTGEGLTLPIETPPSVPMDPPENLLPPPYNEPAESSDDNFMIFERGIDDFHDSPIVSD